MQVAIGCADPALADSATAAVASVGAHPVPCPDLAALATAWRAVDAVIVDPVQLAGMATEPLPPGPALIAVVDDRAASPQTWAAATGLQAVAVVGLPGGQPLLIDTLRLFPARTRGGLVVGVVGCGGGAGASTVAAALALAAARAGRRVLLVDDDRYAGGLDLLFAAEGRPGARWPHLITRSTADLTGLVEIGGVSLLSWDRGGEPGTPPPRLRAGLLSAAAVRFEVVVVDLPREPAQVTAAGCEELLLVCRREVRGAAAALTLTAAVRGAAGRVRLVASGVGRRDLPARELAGVLGLPLALDLPADPALARRAGSAGLHRLPPRNRTLARCRRLLTELLASREAVTG